MPEKKKEIIQLSQEFTDKINIAAGPDSMVYQQCLDAGDRENFLVQTPKQQVQAGTNTGMLINGVLVVQTGMGYQSSSTEGNALLSFSTPPFPGKQKIGDPSAILDPVRPQVRRSCRLSNDETFYQVEKIMDEWNSIGDLVGDEWLRGDQNQEEQHGTTSDSDWWVRFMNGENMVDILFGNSVRNDNVLTFSGRN